MAKTNKNFKGKGKRSGNYRKDTDKVERKDVRGGDLNAIDACDNDVSWYTLNPTIMENAAKLPFNVMAGYPITTRWAEKGLEELQPGRDDKYDMFMPGVASLQWCPSVGVADSASDPINMAGMQLWLDIRSKTSGTMYYEQPDAIIAVAALSSLFEFYAYHVRMYGIARYYLFENRYVGEAMLRVLGLSESQIDLMISNLSDYRLTINWMAQQINRLYMPKDVFKLVERRLWLNSHVWMDNPTVRSQFYIFNQTKVLKFVEMTGDKVFGRLELEPMAGFATVAQVRKAFKELYNSIAASSSMGYIMADFKRAYGDNGRIVANLIGEDYQVIPKYNEEVLMQIHNFDPVGEIVDVYENGFIYQDPSSGFTVLKSQPIVMNGYAANDLRMTNKIVDVRLDNPTAADVMVASRWLTCLEVEKSGTEQAPIYKTLITACGSEIPESINVAYFTDMSTLQIVELSSLYWNNLQEVFISSGTYNAKLVRGNFAETQAFAKLVTFNQHPIVWMMPYQIEATTTGQSISTHGDTNLVPFIGVCNDLYNYRTVEFDDVANIHRAALAAEFSNPTA